MKHLHSLITAVSVLVMTFTACQKEGPAAISVLQDKYEIGFAGETTTIGVKSNRNWTASADVEWIRLSPAQAEAADFLSYIMMTVEGNDGLARTGKVNIAANDGSISMEVTVIQSENGEIIINGDQFIRYLTLVAEGKASDGFRLGADIDLAGKTLPEVASMTNKLDGRNHVIKNWSSSKPMFSEIAASGSISNLEFDASCKFTLNTSDETFGFLSSVNNGTVNGVISRAEIIIESFAKTCFGVICGKNTATMSNCANYGSISYAGAPQTAGSAYIAGIVGQSTGATAVVSQCVNEGSIDLSFNDILAQSIYAAGVVGTNNANAKILNSTNAADIKVCSPGFTSNAQTSGIVCYSGGEVSDCTNRGSITLLSESAEGKADGQVKGTAVAGIATYEGWAEGVMKNCNNYGDITLRAGYPIGYQTVGSATKFATNVAGIVAHAYNCGLEGCRNYGSVTSDIKSLDKCPAEGFQTTARHSVAGIVGSSWGNIVKCDNEGKVSATWITTTHDATLAKNFVMMAGGITGGSYNGGLTDKSVISECNNKADVLINCDSSGSNNNVGGIVGWSSKEAACAALIEKCTNSATVTHDGFGKVRMGGIAGAGSTLKSCTNCGKVYLKGATTNSCVGGILGWFNFNGVVDCRNTGDVVSDVKINNAFNSTSGNYSSQAGIGGLVGGHGNTDVTFTGNAVNCAVSAPAGCKFASMVIGMTDRDKTPAAGKALNIGTAESPIKVKGLFNGTVLTSSNFQDYVKYEGFVNLNSAVVYNTVYGE